MKSSPGKRFILSLTQEILQQVDALAEEQGISRAELFRRAMILFLEQEKRRKKEDVERKLREEAFQTTENLRKQYGHLGAGEKPSADLIRRRRDNAMRAISPEGEV